jgi:hypothetical protein
VIIAFCGAHDLPLKEIAAHLLQQLVALPTGAIVLLRRGRSTDPGRFEDLTQALCSNLNIPVEWAPPGEGGREAVFERDIQMVAKADAVVCYFHPDRVMEGGTGHVAEKALDADKPLYAYTLFEQGVDWVGGIEPVG